MTIQDLGSLAEVVGAIATVAALVYLAIQIRANTVSLQVESRRSSFEASAKALLAITENDEVARIFNEGLVDFFNLNATDRMRFTMLLTLFVSPISVVRDEARIGVDIQSHQFDGVVRLLCTPGGKQWWQATRNSFNQEFQQYIEIKILEYGQPAAADRGH